MRVTKLLFLLFVVVHRGRAAVVSDSVSYSFHVPGEWGTLSVENANCCSFVKLPRNETSKREGLPDAIGLGVQKGGSTSLAIYLMLHKRYAKSAPKEVHFFDQGPGTQQLSAYKRAWKQHENTTDIIRFDFTPGYIWTPSAACRIKHVFPNMKFMVVLRNPAERAYSEFTMVRTLCHNFTDQMCAWIYSPFLEYAKIGIADLRERGCAFDDGGQNGTPRSWNDCFQCLVFHFRYRFLCDDRPYLFHLGNNKRQCFHFGAQFVSRGLYAAQLAWWFELFDPQNFLIINSNEFYKDTMGELEKVNAFFGVEEKFNEARTQKIKMEGDYSMFDDTDKEETLALLREYYDRPNQELYRLLRETGHSGFAPFEPPGGNRPLPPDSEGEALRTAGSEQPLKTGDSPTAVEALPAAVPAAESEAQALSTDQSIPEAEALTQRSEPKIPENTETETFEAVDGSAEISSSDAGRSDDEVELEAPRATVRAFLRLADRGKLPNKLSSRHFGRLSWPVMTLLLTGFVVFSFFLFGRIR